MLKSCQGASLLCQLELNRN